MRYEHARVRRATCGRWRRDDWPGRSWLPQRWFWPPWSPESPPGPTPIGYGDPGATLSTLQCRSRRRSSWWTLG